MAFTFDEIERIALTKFRSRNFLEAAMFYERLEQSAVSELRSDLAQGYCINNQAVFFSAQAGFTMRLQGQWHVWTSLTQNLMVRVMRWRGAMCPGFPRLTAATIII